MLEFTHRAVSLAHRYSALVMVNSDIELAKLSGADGVHFTGKQLLMCTERPDMTWCSASCHNEAELAHAGRIGFDFAMLSPVLPTLSHPGAAHLGWEKFAEIIDGTTLPIYALGGLVANDIDTAQESRCARHRAIASGVDLNLGNPPTLAAVRRDTLQRPIYPDRSACIARSKKGGKGSCYPTMKISCIADRSRLVRRMASLRQTTEGQFKRDVVFVNGRLGSIVGVYEADVDSVFVGADLRQAGQVATQTDA